MSNNPVMIKKVRTNIFGFWLDLRLFENGNTLEISKIKVTKLQSNPPWSTAFCQWSRSFPPDEAHEDNMSSKSSITGGKRGQLPPGYWCIQCTFARIPRVIQPYRANLRLLTCNRCMNPGFVIQSIIYRTTAFRT